MEGGGVKGIREIPEGWNIVRLGNAVEINEASRDPTRENPDEKILYIDIESVEGGLESLKWQRKFWEKKRHQEQEE